MVIRAQSVGRLRARHEGALIGVNLTVPCPSPEGTLTEFQFRTGHDAACASGDGLVEHNNGGFVIRGADRASPFRRAQASPGRFDPARARLRLIPRIALAFFSEPAMLRFRSIPEL